MSFGPIVTASIYDPHYPLWTCRIHARACYSFAFDSTIFNNFHTHLRETSCVCALLSFKYPHCPSFTILRVYFWLAARPKFIENCAVENENRYYFQKTLIQQLVVQQIDNRLNESGPNSLARREPLECVLAWPVCTASLQTHIINWWQIKRVSECCKWALHSLRHSSYLYSSSQIYTSQCADKLTP